MIRLPADAAGIDQAAKVIRAGGVVALPTDTFYGLAVDPFRPDALARLFEVKGRPAERAVPLIAGDLEQVVSRLGALPPPGRALADRFWPGPLTLVIDAPAALARDVSGGTGRVGVRVPTHEVARALCRACGSPLTATSANISGAPASASPDDVERALGARIDMLLDAGPTPGGAASTVVDVTGSAPLLVRAGAVSWSEVVACVDRG